MIFHSAARIQFFPLRAGQRSASDRKRAERERGFRFWGFKDLGFRVWGFKGLGLGFGG